MSGCAAVGCSNRGDKGFLMKSFPRDPKRRAIWASKINRDNWQPNDHSRLCEVHFDANQWEKTREDGSRRLKCNAVPTSFDNSKLVAKRKKPKIAIHKEMKKFIVPLTGDDKLNSKTNSSSNDDDESKACEKSSENSKGSRNFAINEENKTISQSDCRIKSEHGDKFVNSDPKPVWKSILKQNLNSNERKNVLTTNHSQTECEESLSSRPDLEIKRFGSPTINIACQSYRKEIKIENFKDKVSTKESNSSILQKTSKLDNKEVGDLRCRLCATKHSGNYIPIFGESEVAEKISRCLPIIVLPTDKLPLQICQECLKNLNISYKLMIGSLKADSCLRSSENLKSNKLLQEFNKQPLAPAKKLREIRPAPRAEPVFRINGPITCDICDELFKDMNLFDDHIETTHLLKWRCSFCDHSFETSQELIAHKTLNHSGQILTCQDCVSPDNNNSGETECEVNDEIDVKDVKTEIINLNNTNDEINSINLPILNCTKCKMVFDDAKQFRKHHIIHLPRRIRCSICFKRCPSIFEYLTHVKISHNKIRRSNLRKRNITHVCKYCKKVFLNKQQLITHLRKHKKEMFEDPSVTVYKCVTCPKKFVDRALYQKHRNVHDPDCWHKFRCTICDRSFMDRFKLKIHQSIHEGVKPYQCDVCSRSFNRNANMIRHRAKHFEQSCRHCEETFNNTQSLREHLKDIHGDTLNPKKSSTKDLKKGGDGDKNNGNNGDCFMCGYCGKQLTSYYSLLDHERIHTGDKPYVCQHCDKAFRSLTARWDHMVRHEKGNYICELCGKSMSNKLNLRRHLRKHKAIAEKKFQCKDCGKLFHVRWKLNAHIIRIHHSSPNKN